jgi:glycosyltransferase involved in cell wall biosynthesis
MQMGEPHDWNLLMPWLGAAQQKRLGRFGVVKPGMDRFLASHGVNAMFVQNAVPFRRPATMPVTERENSVGIWLSGSSDYRKPVLPSLLAVAGISGLRLRAAGLGELGYRVVEELRIPTAAKFARPISHSDVLAQMRQTVATVYVTLSECMPMVPLESIAQGSPCVVGPATELFDDDPGLAALLVVKDPTDPAAIRRALAAVLDDRARLLERCTDYLESLNARASRTLTAFLG